MELGPFTSPTQAEKAHRWDRQHVAQLVLGFEESSADVSQRQFAEQQGVPRTTLQFWLGRKGRLELDAPLADFLESPAGVTFLQRLLVALHLVFAQDASCGLRKICRFLQLTRLNRVVAASYGSQHKLAAAIGREIVHFGNHEQQRLAEQMPARQITVCEDETFHPETCLVAIEPLSGFIVLEAYRDRRDAETWNQSLAEALDGLPIDVLQVVSDEARGLIAHATEGLGAHHSPDVFHVQQELSRATAFPLQNQTRRAADAAEQARRSAGQLATERDACHAECPDSSVAADLTVQAAQAEMALAAAATHATACRGRQEQVQTARRGLSDDYHPFGLDTGAARDAADVSRRLQARFDEIERLAGEANLSQACRDRIAKARRVLAAMVATIAFFWQSVWSWVDRLSLSPEQERSLIEDLLPAKYLSLAAGKAKTAARRRELQATADRLHSRVRDGPLSQLPEEERAVLEQTAADWAALFQRSSSCVEGRNGQLALWHHSLHRLSPQRLTSLTVLHNFFHRRPDGTTAAERFFGVVPADLFEWLLDHVPLPSRPATSHRIAA